MELNHITAAAAMQQQKQHWLQEEPERGRGQEQEREREVVSLASSMTNTPATVTPNSLSNVVSPMFTPVSTGNNTPVVELSPRSSPTATTTAHQQQQQNVMRMQDVIGGTSLASSSTSGASVIPRSLTQSTLENLDKLDRSVSTSRQHLLPAEAATRGAHKPSSSSMDSPSHGPLRSPRMFAWATVSPLLSPIGTPMRRHLRNMKDYLQDIGHLTTIDPHDAWLPITESRGGNAYYAAFHNLNAIIGFQALLLPVAFTFLGWTWGILTLTFAFAWFMYTKWLLVEMHECVPGRRISRFIDLSETAFGPRWGFILAVPLVLQLAVGTCVGLITFGGTSLELFFRTVCPTCSNPLSPIEWYLVFTLFCVLLAHFPNLNSVAGVSLVGAIMAVAYCTLVWSLSISVPRPPIVTYNVVMGKSPAAKVFLILNAIGLVAFAFRGHNLSLEIQATMPSTLKHPARVPMWKGALWAFAVTAFCFVPLSIGGYWAYGDKMLRKGILFSILAFHGKEISSVLLGITFMFVVLQCLCSFQIYAMPVFDLAEQAYTKRTNRKMNSYLRFISRAFFVFFIFFLAIAIPFLQSLAGLLGGLSIPLSFFLPSLMFLRLKKPARGSIHWYLNLGLSVVGFLLAVAVTSGGIWSIVETGINLDFFHPP